MLAQVRTATVASGGTFTEPIVIRGAIAVGVEVAALTSCQAFIRAGNASSATDMPRLKTLSGDAVTLAFGPGSFAALITDQVFGFHSFALELSAAQTAGRSFLIHAK